MKFILKHIFNLQPPISKSIPVPNVTVTKSTPICYTHTIGNQMISLAPSGSSTTTNTSTSLSTSSTTVPSATAASAITQLTDEQKRIVFEFKQKLAALPSDQQGAYIAANKGTLLNQLNFQPSQLTLLRNNHIQLQLSRPTQIKVNQASGGQPQPSQVQKRPLPVGAGTIRQPDDGQPSQSQPQPNFNTKQKNIAWIENQIKKDQQEALNPKYKIPFKSKDDAIKRLLRYHVFHELDSSPEEMIKAEDDFEEESNDLLSKYHSMLDRYHFLLMQESKRMVSSSEEVMLARLWDSEERQIHAREKEEVENDNLIQNVPLLDANQRQQYSQYLNAIKSKTQNTHEPIVLPPVSQTSITPLAASSTTTTEEQISTAINLNNINNDQISTITTTENEELNITSSCNRKRKRTGSGESSNSSKIGLKFARSESGNWKSSQGSNYENYSYQQQQQNQTNMLNSDSDEEFTLKDVDTERAVGSILDDSHDEDDVDDVLEGVNMGEDDVVAAAFGTTADSVQNAINSILDTLPQGDRIETPDINNITGLLDSIEDETGHERDPITEAAVNSIPQF